MQTSHQSRRSNLTRKKDFSEILKDHFLFTFFSFLNSFFFFGKGSQVAGVEFNFIRSSFFTISYWWNIQRGELETRPYWMRISASWLPVSEYINVRNKKQKITLTSLPIPRPCQRTIQSFTEKSKCSLSIRTPFTHPIVYRF